MELADLKNKALSLPYQPGVYIMRDKDGKVIYVGKAKKLKNRVSQYFQDTASHSYKTRQMVGKISDFDVIVCSTEFEALVLECSQIKQYKPKYNILLKDDKGYPYLRLNTKDAYPVISVASKIADDGAEYFGPFGTRHATKLLLDAILSALKLPSCSKKFPRDVGKDRPCLNYHMDKCSGWCQELCMAGEYRSRMEQARLLLSGHYKRVAEQIRNEMEKAADELNFEQAAILRDRLSAIEILGTKQLITSAKNADLDVIGYGTTDSKSCFSVLHYSDGVLVDKEYEVQDAVEDAEAFVSALLKQYYLSRGFAARTVLLPFAIGDGNMFAQFLEQRFGKKTRFLVPQRGRNAKLVQLSVKNAQEEAERASDKDQHINKTLLLLSDMLGIVLPNRIESYDISNISGTDIVASMIVFENGNPCKRDYKQFKLKNMEGQDDYASMRQVLERRFARYQSRDNGFHILPDLLLIDGGANHAKVVMDVLNNTGLSVPVFGMVKDDRHRTRALVTADNSLIGIDSQQSIFALIGNIQEETHRFAIGYHKKLRSRRLRYSELDAISGIGETRKALLLKHFKSITAISNATLSELENLLPKDAAYSVFAYFQNKKQGSE